MSLLGAGRTEHPLQGQRHAHQRQESAAAHFRRPERRLHRGLIIEQSLKGLVLSQLFQAAPKARPTCMRPVAQGFRDSVEIDSPAQR
jgi:hypothetical protein